MEFDAFVSQAVTEGKRKPERGQRLSIADLCERHHGEHPDDDWVACARWYCGTKGIPVTQLADGDFAALAKALPSIRKAYATHAKRGVFRWWGTEKGEG